jgi:WD40 repeat protein
MRYNAFISYSHSADNMLASKLQSALHSIAKPPLKQAPIRVCLDKSSLAANWSLWPEIEAKLSDSEYFLLLASPQAAQSPWVEKEIKWWLKHRSIEKMLIGVTDGEIVWNRVTNDFDWKQSAALPSCLHGIFKDEPFYADFRKAKKENKLSIKLPFFRNIVPVFNKSASASRDSVSVFRDPVLNIAARLLEKDKDDIDSEDIRQNKKNKRLVQLAVGISLIAIVSAVAGVYEADQQKKDKTSRKLANLSQTISKQQANLLSQSTLIAAQGIKTFQTLPADQALYQNLSLLGPEPFKQRSYHGLMDLVFSPHGKYLVKLPYDGPALVEETVSGKTIVSLINLSRSNEPENAIRQVSFSNDEKRITTRCSLGLSTFVWELPSGREIFRTPSNRGSMITAVLSGNGKYLATGHTDGRVSVWEIDRQKEIASFSHSDPPHMMEFSQDGKYLAVSNSLKVYNGPPSISKVRLFNVKKNIEIAVLQHKSAVMDMTFSPDDNYLATTSRVGPEQKENERIGEVKIWRTDSGLEVASLNHDKSVEKITFTTNSKYLLTGSSDGKARLWDVINGKEQLTVDHGSNVKLVDGLEIEGFSYLVSAGDDGILRLWGLDIPVLERLRLLASSGSPNILSLVHNAEELYIATLSHSLTADASANPKTYQKDMRIWKVEDIKSKLPLEHEHAVGIARFSPDGRHLATVDFQMPTSQLIPKTSATQASTKFMDLGKGRLHIWNVVSRKQLSHLKHPGTIMSIGYHPSGKYVATACVDGKVRVFETSNGKNVSTLKHDGWIFELTFSPDGQYVATSSGKPELLGGKNGDAVVSIWQWQTKRQVGKLKFDTAVFTLSYSPDGRYLAAGGQDGVVHIVQASDGQEVKILPHKYPILALGFSPDGTHLATASGGTASNDPPVPRGNTTLWRVNDGQKTILRNHKSFAMSIAFSQDENYVASIDQDGWIGVWTTKDGREITNIKHDEHISEAKINFSPDSKYIITAFGNKAQIWEVTTGEEVARREHEEGALWEAIFSPDGKYLATAGTDTTAKIWLWHPQDLIDEACARLQKNLTQEEWRQYVKDEIAYETTCENLGTPEN